MLTILLITVTLCTLAIWGVAKVAAKAMDRFGLDLMSALLWLGLAERSGER